MKKQEKEDGIVDGFSSDQQMKHEEIIIQQRKKTEVEVTHKEEVKFKIPPPEEIKSKSYSLNPDIVTGWAPKNDLPVPIPMLFENKRVDSIVKKLLQKKNQKIKLSYLGPRFENTFYAWYDKQFQFPYRHIKAPHNMKFTNRAFCGQHWDAEDGIIFDSFFESGNLDLAVQVGEREYDIYIRVDSNTRGHIQWFNFTMKNLQKLQKYKINICNLQKNKSLYSRGQKPYILSYKKLEKEKKGWEQSGDGIKFEQKPGKSAKVLNYQFNYHYKLSFDYYTEYESDTIQVAYCVPYTYTQLLNYLRGLEQKVGYKQFLFQSKLCLSLGGLQIPMITIHDNYSKQQEMKQVYHQSGNRISKKCIIICGRVHPGQSNGSHMMQGFLDFLCGQSKQAKMLRQNFVFKIVPMLNPDGVTLGNFRTGISGKDFNRQYRNPQKSIFPEVYAFKKLVIQNKSMYGQNLLMFLDFHGHSTKKNVFVYGPQFPIIQRHYYECRVFPKILGNLTCMFRYYSCSFKVSQFKQTTARAIFLRKVMIPLSYTIQASNGSFYDHEALKDVMFNVNLWLEMGKKIGQSLAEYGDLIIQSEKFKLEKMQNKKLKKQIKIRKNSKIKSAHHSNNHNSINGGRQMCILANTENEHIKRIYEEIKKAEEQKEHQKNQEDEISEGSSDGQGQKDDLSPQKLNILFQIIKNKKANMSERHRKKFIDEQNKHSKTNQHQQEMSNQSQQLNIKPADILLPLPEESDDKQDEEIFRNNMNQKGYFLRKNHPISYMEQRKKQKIAAKIINFSFIGHTRPINFSTQRRSLNNNKFDLSEPGSLSKFQKASTQDQSKTSNQKVLDLSDNTFRNTYAGPISSANSNKQVKLGQKQLTFFNVSPRKLISGRLQQFKYKRLFIDQYRFENSNK